MIPNCKQIDNKFNYSTEEQKIGTWIDGKPIYRKTLSFSPLPNNTYENKLHGIKNIDQIIGIKGIAFPLGQLTDGSYFLSINSFKISCSASRKVVQIETTSDRSAYMAYVLLEYTKTTD